MSEERGAVLEEGCHALNATHNSRAGRPLTFIGSVPFKPNVGENVHRTAHEFLGEAYDPYGLAPSDTPRRCLADILRSADTLMSTDTPLMYARLMLSV